MLLITNKMDAANVYRGKLITESTFVIDEPKSWDEISELIKFNSKEYWYLKRLISWSLLEDKYIYHNVLESGLRRQDAYELQLTLLSNQKQPNIEIFPDQAWLINWAVELAVAKDDWRDLRINKYD